MPRRLVATQRTVPVERFAEYDALWASVAAAVTDAGGHAWRFRSVHGADAYLEFIESRALDELLETGRIARARQALGEAFGGGASGEWEEAPPA